MTGCTRIIAAAILTFGIASAASAAGPALAPAPYLPPPVGTILDYGSWRCAVEAEEGLDTVCADAGKRARIYGHFVLHGTMDPQGYAGAVPAGVCNVSAPEAADLRLDQAGRDAVADLWPLAVGKSAVATFRDGSMRLELLVSHTERMFVAGRNRDLYVVVGRGDLGQSPPCAGAQRGGRGYYQSIWWYDPGDGIVVKRRFSWLTGGDKGLTRDDQLAAAIFPLAPVAPTRTARPARQSTRAVRPRPRVELPAAPAQAAYRAPPPGSVVVYDRWRCNVETAQGLDLLCGDGRRKARLFGHFILHGVPEARRFAGSVSSVECFTDEYAGGAGLIVFTHLELRDPARRKLQAFWPLKVGRKIAFSVHHGGMRSERIDWTLKVAGVESLSIAGKTRRVYRIDGSATYQVCSDLPGPYESDPKFVQSWWYDPADGVTVKSVRRWTSGPDRGIEYAFNLVRAEIPAARGAQPVIASREMAKPAPLPVAIDKTPPLFVTPKSIDATGAAVDIVGRVRDESRIVEFTVDGRRTAIAADGSFRVRRGVATGVTRLQLAATDEWGNSARQTVTVRRRGAAPVVARPAADNDPPVIELPASIQATRGAVDVAGRVRDRSRIIEVTVDGRPVRLDADGRFKVRRAPKPGAGRLVVVAIDEWGNRAQAVARLGAAGAQRPFASIPFGGYHALVVGNNTYRHLANLETAVNDATTVAKLLEDQYGFKVTLMRDATRGDLMRALAGYRARLKVDDNLLVYYAGHGILDKDTREGYWLPVDAEENVPTNWVSTNDITTMLRAIRAKHVMVVADSCYSGTLVRAASARMRTANERTGWLARMAKKRARTALVSGGLEPVIDSDGGDHSVFARAFLAALRENTDVLEGQALFDALKRPVVLNSDQTPQYSDIRRAGHDGGDFLFVRR